jgi:hypothetical protein
MIFPNYRTIVVIAICIAPIVVGVLLFRGVRLARLGFKVPTRIFSVLLCMCGGCLLFLYGCMSTFSSTEHSSAIYSPDHRKAMRIENWDAGALGGSTSVVLYSHFGVITKTIFSGEYYQADKSSVQWLNNSEILIRYDSSYGTSTSPFCEGSRSVAVRCEPVKYAYPRTISIN